MTTIPNPGDRIRLVTMHDDPDPIPIGPVGTVVVAVYSHAGQRPWHQIDVAWDNGRTLMLVAPPDEFDIVDAEADGP
jgi:hypothetical protein